ncbi:MAG: low molecular weight phosphotyrosine protein phosphatase, partial [Propionicimonas sp.]
PGSGIPDPWYGTAEGFNQTLAAIEAAMPELMRRARELARA